MAESEPKATPTSRGAGRPRRRKRTVALWGCSFTSLIGTGLAVAAIAWTASSYVGLARREVALEQAWSGVENACLHRVDLASDLLAVLRRTDHGAAEEVRRIEALRDEASRFVATPRLLDQADRCRAYQTLHEGLASELEALFPLLDRRLPPRDAEAIAGVREQLEDTAARLADARGRYDRAARTYNEYLSGFPERVLGPWFGFREKTLWEGAIGPDRASP